MGYLTGALANSEYKPYVTGLLPGDPLLVTAACRRPAAGQRFLQRMNLPSRVGCSPLGPKWMIRLYTVSTTSMNRAMGAILPAPGPGAILASSCVISTPSPAGRARLSENESTTGFLGSILSDTIARPDVPCLILRHQSFRTLSIAQLQQGQSRTERVEKEPIVRHKDDCAGI